MRYAPTWAVCDIQISDKYPCAQYGFNSYHLSDDLNSSKGILRDRVVWNHLISETTCFQGRPSSCAIIESVSNRNYFHFVILNAVKDLENVSWDIRDASLRSAWHCFLIVVFILIHHLQKRCERGGRIHFTKIRKIFQLAMDIRQWTMENWQLTIIFLPSCF